MAQCLRARTALSEDASLIPSAHKAAHSCLCVTLAQGYLMSSSSIANTQNACTHEINKLKVSGKGRAIREVAGVGFERICEGFLQIRGG